MTINTKTLAAIDIGTNAIRLSYPTWKNTPRKPCSKIAFLRTYPVREDVFTTGEIGQQKRKRLCETMQGFSLYIMSAFSVESYKAYATCAMREARNGKSVAEQIKECDLNIEIISGTKEAETIFAGGMNEWWMMTKPTYTWMSVAVAPR